MKNNRHKQTIKNIIPHGNSKGFDTLRPMEITLISQSPSVSHGKVERCLGMSCFSCNDVLGLTNKTPIVFSYLKFTKSEGILMKKTRLLVKLPSKQYILNTLNINIHGTQTKRLYKRENKVSISCVLSPADKFPQAKRYEDDDFQWNVKIRRVKIQRAKVGLFKRIKGVFR